MLARVAKARVSCDDVSQQKKKKTKQRQKKRQKERKKRREKDEEKEKRKKKQGKNEERQIDPVFRRTPRQTRYRDRTGTRNVVDSLISIISSER